MRRFQTKRRKNRNRLTRKNYLSKLYNLYPKCLHDTLPNDESYGKNITTYGEMNYKGLEDLYNYIKEKHNITTFMDVGSGRGKLCMHMANNPEIKKVIGIEIVKNRHNDALKLLQQLESSYANKVSLIHGDICNEDVKHLFNKKGNVLVWMSNLCFSNEVSSAIYDRLLQILPKGSIIACSNRLKDEEPNDNIKCQMSWNEQGSNVNIYLI